jgi:hypothetical protein
MEKNIGRIDKRLRILLGIIVIIVGAYLKSVWGVLGIIPIVTAQIATCPIYTLFGLNTIKKSKKRRAH